MGMTTSGLTELISTDEQTAAVAPDHELGCIEWALEVIVEQAAAEGVVLVGDIVETFHRETLGDLARAAVAIECYCNGEGE
jgi:hypothetical protein